MPDSRDPRMTSHEGEGRRSEVVALLAEAAEWRLIGLLLERPRPGWSEEVAALGRETRNDPLRAAAEHAAAATEGEYLSLLGPGGAVSPREVTYRSFEDPGWILSRLATMYEAFAFTPRVEEPPDHVAVEAGFVGYLLLKEAFARGADDGAAAETTAAARQDFLATHLAPMAGPVAERLVACGPSSFAEAARLLAERVPPAPPGAHAGAPSEVPAACGLCPGVDEPPIF